MYCAPSRVALVWDSVCKQTGVRVDNLTGNFRKFMEISTISVGKCPFAVSDREIYQYLLELSPIDGQFNEIYHIQELSDVVFARCALMYMHSSESMSKLWTVIFRKLLVILGILPLFKYFLILGNILVFCGKFRKFIVEYSLKFRQFQAVWTVFGQNVFLVNFLDSL